MTGNESAARPPTPYTPQSPAAGYRKARLPPTGGSSAWGSSLPALFLREISTSSHRLVRPVPHVSFRSLFAFKGPNATADFLESLKKSHRRRSP